MVIQFILLFSGFEINRYDNNNFAPEKVRFCCEREKDLSCLDIKRPFNGRPNPTWLPPDNCCGERPYNTNLKVSQKKILDRQIVKSQENFAEVITFN